jgi:hypothetical protein
MVVISHKTHTPKARVIDLIGIIFRHRAYLRDIAALISKGSRLTRRPSTQPMMDGGYFYQLLPTAHLHPPRYNQ